MGRRADAVHRLGAAIFCQLGHLGRESVGGASAHAPVGPSAIRSPRDFAAPHPLAVGEIDELVEAFVAAAENTRRAGYDGVELHGGHGYLIAQFLSAAVNRREDAYGGDLAGRMRLLDRILRGIRERSGEDFTIGVRLSADEEIPDGMHLEDTLEIARRLSDLGDVDYLNVTLGQRGAYVKDITYPEGVAVESAAAVKAASRLPWSSPGASSARSWRFAATAYGCPSRAWATPLPRTAPATRSLGTWAMAGRAAAAARSPT
jgi:2,4-dienoyl-CoA reductase (NADPH2)